MISIEAIGRSSANANGVNLTGWAFWVVACLICAWPLTVFSMKHYLPAIDNDEIEYFLETQTCLQHGFSGGYFSINDQIPVSRIHFGLHGPVFVCTYGLLGRLIGWRNESPYVLNGLIFLLSWGALGFALRDEPSKRLAVASFVLANGYFFLFLPSMLQESFHISLAVAMAAMWRLALKKNTLTAWAGLLLLLAFATQARYIWALVVPTIVYSFLRHRISSATPSRSRIVVTMAFSAFIGVACIYLSMQWLTRWTAPAVVTPETIFNAVSLISWQVLPIAAENVKAFFSPPSIGMFHAYPIYFRMSILATFGIFGWIAATDRSPLNRETAAYSLLLLVAPFAAQVLYYTVDGYRELRILSAFHALAVLTFLSCADLRWNEWSRHIRRLSIAAGVTVFVANAWLSVQATEMPYRLNWNRQRAAEFDDSAKRLFERMARAMVVAADGSSFCKTLYGPLEVLSDPSTLHLPFGFAFSLIQSDRWERIPPLKGKYAILQNTPSPLSTMFDNSPNWRLVGPFDRFRLYRSTVNCTTSTAD